MEPMKGTIAAMGKPMGKPAAPKASGHPHGNLGTYLHPAKNGGMKGKS